MRAVRLSVLAIFLVAVSAPGQQSRITVAQAKLLVRAVLRHENLAFPSRYCELEQLDKGGKPFAPGFYSFGANCDYPNTGATTVFGLYVVSVRTGEVWEYNQCRMVTFPQLVGLRRKMLGGAGLADLPKDKPPCE